ncbi:MAG: nitrate reductase molybdenum cofactor assembly chaperone [Acidobacteriota bacterium]
MHIYEVLANLFEYPDKDWVVQLDNSTQLIESKYPELLLSYREYSQQLCALSLVTAQEYYTQTFDLNPICALEIGYHLFGENYKRGIFLAKLRETEITYQVEQDGQLPDYLPILLRLLTKLPENEFRSDLIRECLLPALNKMIDAAGQNENPYCELLKITVMALSIELASCTTMVNDAIVQEREFYV